MKKFFSIILLLCVLVGTLSLSACSNGSDATKKDNSFSINDNYVIVIPEDASFTEIVSGKKIAQAIKHSTGLDIPVVSDSEKASELEIIVGDSSRDGVSVAQNNAGEMGYSIYASKKKVFIYGSDDRLLEIATDSFINDYVVISSTITLSKKLSVTYTGLFSKPNLTLNGVDISKYTIVYAADGSTTHYRSKVNAWVESARYEDAAHAAANEIYLLTGKKLPVVSAKDVEEVDYEILVGKVAGREEVNEFYVTYGVGYSDERYGYGLVGNKLLISGGSPNSAYYAACDFAKQCRTLRSSDFTSSLVDSRVDLVKVACIGDDATHGSSSSDVNTHNYVTYLQKMLGFGYYLANYALPDVTSAEYIEQAEYTLSKNFVPEVLIVMLGMSDSNPTKSTFLKETYKDIFKQSVTQMIEEYRKINPSIQVYFVTPTYKATSAFWETNISEIAESTRELAEELTEELIDIYATSKQENWSFPNGKHLMNEGYEILADAIFENLKYSIRIK